MARRPSPEEFWLQSQLDKPLNREELAKESHKLAHLSPYHVAEQYRDAYEACKMDGENLPRARSVQTLVIVWKLLWKWRRQRPLGRD